MLEVTQLFTFIVVKNPKLLERKTTWEEITFVLSIYIVLAPIRYNTIITSFMKRATSI